MVCRHELELKEIHSQKLCLSYPNPTPYAFSSIPELVIVITTAVAIITARVVVVVFSIDVRKYNRADYYRYRSNNNFSNLKTLYHWIKV